MVPHTRIADMPVKLSNQVNTRPSPHMVVRNVRQAAASETLVYDVRGVVVIVIQKDMSYKSAGMGTPRLFTQPKTCGAWPILARESSILELP